MVLIDNNFTVEIEITLSTALEEARDFEGIENDDNGDDDADFVPLEESEDAKMNFVE